MCVQMVPGRFVEEVALACLGGPFDGFHQVYPLYSVGQVCLGI